MVIQLKCLIRLIFVFILAIHTAGCVYPSCAKISSMVSDKLKKINVEMSKKEIMNQIGKPDYVGKYPGEFFSKKTLLNLQKERSRIFYPSNLPEILPEGSENWNYLYSFSFEEGTGFSLYFKPDGKLIGWDVSSLILPQDWDEIIARKKNALPAGR